ncbi:MAG: radical SAM protein [Desulfobacteraceae bacterium]|nr:radical SAM protein [Desulfobacteraceae bacterium]
MDSKKLMPVLAAAVEAGVAIDYVETNCAWFKDSGHASAVIKNLFKTGVHTLLISISPFHNEHIPYARVKGVIDACRSNGVKVFPWVDSFAGDLSRLDENKTHSLSEFEQVFGPNYLESIPEKYWIHMGGRALDTFRPVYPLQRVQHILVDSISSCSRVFSDTTHFHIDLYGNYIPGLCSGLAFPMEELGKPLDPGKYLLLEQLIFKGIRGLYNFACRNWGYIPNRKSYLNHCDLCTEIRYYLFNLDKDGKLFPELSPDGFYAEPRTD